MGRPRAWASDLKAGAGRPGRRPGSYAGPCLYAPPDSTPKSTTRYSRTLLSVSKALRHSVIVHVQSPPIFVIGTASWFFPTSISLSVRLKYDPPGKSLLRHLELTFRTTRLRLSLAYCPPFAFKGAICQAMADVKSEMQLQGFKGRVQIPICFATFPFCHSCTHNFSKHFSQR